MSEEREVAIRLEGVKKQYHLGIINRKTLQADLQSWWARKRGKDDPNVKIGTNVQKVGKKFLALNGIDLTIYKGERIGIIGRNGAGKSTLLKLLSRITAPTEGTIDIWGKISSLLEVGTGFHREMTGRNNIYMSGAILGMKRAEIDSKIEQIIEFSEIGSYIDTPVKRYSSGMYVKLGFAVAAFLDSDILVMDEVLAVGDMAFQKKCLDKMREEADIEGKTVLYVSHNMDTIRRLCDRCIVLDQGKVIFDGNVEEAISIYLEANIEENPIDINLKNKVADKGSYVQLEHLTLMNKVSPLYQSDEMLQLLLNIYVSRPIENVFLRLTFRNRVNTGIGTARSQPFPLKELGQHKISLSMPLTQLAKGKFYISVGLFQNDEIGRIISLTHITRAFQIEIQGLPIWNISTYGYVQLSEILVREAESESFDGINEGDL